jgi:hypothetical protein
MREVSDRLAVLEGVPTIAEAAMLNAMIPDTLPDELVAEFDSDLASR